jgi:hypothetical protein
MKWEEAVEGNTRDDEITYWQGKKALRNYYMSKELTTRVSI